MRTLLGSGSRSGLSRFQKDSLKEVLLLLLNIIND